MNNELFPIKRLLTFVLVYSALVFAAPAADIVALVIGNNDYTRAEDQLDTPINDAQLMKTTLEALPGGADVKILNDATKEDIEIALGSLKVRARGAKLALVFYSGHGMEGQPDGYASEDTFLLPVEAQIPDVNYLPTRTVPLGTVLKALEGCPVTARAVILDCCRTGAPKATAALAGSTKSFGDIDERVKKALGNAIVPEATLIAFAASPGRKAAAFLTETDENSPFTKFLTDQLATGHGDLRKIVGDAAFITEQRTANRQVPYVTYKGAESAIRQITFRSDPMPLPVTPQFGTEAAQKTQLSSARIESGTSSLGTGRVSQNGTVRQISSDKAVGTWRVLEKVRPEKGGYEIVWNYTATLSKGAILFEGRKVLVNNKSPTKGDARARSCIYMLAESLNFEGDVDEVNHKGDHLKSTMKFFFDHSFQSFSAQNFENGVMVSELTGSKTK